MRSLRPSHDEIVFAAVARAGRRKRSRYTGAGTGATAPGTGVPSSPAPGSAASTTAQEEEEGEEAAVSTSTDGDGRAANTGRGEARRAIGNPDAAAVMTRVALSCKTELVEEGEGRGASERTGWSLSFCAISNVAIETT